MNANIGQASTALMAAAFGGNLELVKFLLSHGAEPDAISADKSGTLRMGPSIRQHYGFASAVSSGNVDVVRILLDSGVKVDAQDIRGMTPLMLAVSTDRPSVNRPFAATERSGRFVTFETWRNHIGLGPEIQ